MKWVFSGIVPGPSSITAPRFAPGHLSDFTEPIEMLFPGNYNQQYAAACMFFELKWANRIVPDLAYIETKYGISRWVLQRARAKLSRLRLIEHVSYLNSRYGGQHG